MEGNPNVTPKKHKFARSYERHVHGALNKVGPLAQQHLRKINSMFTPRITVSEKTE